MKQKMQNKGTVLITGGAGFIGSHTADELFSRGYSIKILDNLDPKSHYGKWPEYLKPEYEKILGDVRIREDLEKALKGVDFVIHLAAQMDLTTDFASFFNTNATSTALLYEIIINQQLPIKKVIVASSQFVYGEGKWECKIHGELFPKSRLADNLSSAQWEQLCPVCNIELTPLWNKETHQDPSNQYAISKYAQELIALKIGKNYNIPSVAMRYSIVHGPRQSIKNAYSGALRIFTMQLLANKTPSIFEDGKSLRDYVAVTDVANANADVLENPKANYENFNVGSGKSYSVLDLFNLIATELNIKTNAIPTNQYRVGDIRHALSDNSKLKKLGWKPKMSEEETIRNYIKWIKNQDIDSNTVDNALQTLKSTNVIKTVEK
jgi:dTDP-L-rhamnose 4-epimerase